MSRSRQTLVLLAMWAVVTAFELFKAVHIDDTAYLEVARAILAHPLHPMSQLLNWGDSATPIHKQNMPHLLLYLMAAVMKAAPGHFELALHVLWALLSGLAIATFHALARALKAPRPLVWTAIFCLGPAFIPSQNLMLDVPLLAVWMAFFWALAQEDGGGLMAAAVLAAVACLIKYSSLVLLPILSLAIVRRRGPGRRRLGELSLLLIPLGALAGWSLFNWFDYGGIHILERPIATGAVPGLGRRLAVLVSRGILWIVALGAITPFSLAFVGPLGASRTGRQLLVVAAAIAVVSPFIGHAALSAEPVVQSILRGLFLGNGVLVAGLTARGWRGRDDPKSTAASRLPSSGWYLGIWVVGAALFIVVLSPFIAVRHVLLALPAVLLLIARGPDAVRLSRRGLILGVGLTAMAGVLLAASDARLADLNRRKVPELVAQFCRDGARCVSIGHWGWQWYAAKEGLPTYDRERTNLRPGDRVIASQLMGKEALAPRDDARLHLIAKIDEPATPLTWMRPLATEKSGAQGNRSGGFYYFWTSVLWFNKTPPLDRFLVYEVGSP